MYIYKFIFQIHHWNSFLFNQWWTSWWKNMSPSNPQAKFINQGGSHGRLFFLRKIISNGSSRAPNPLWPAVHTWQKLCPVEHGRQSDFLSDVVVSIVMGVPKNGWFMFENSIKMDDWGYPNFRKAPFNQQELGFYGQPSEMDIDRS